MLHFLKVYHISSPSRMTGSAPLIGGRLGKRAQISGQICAHPPVKGVLPKPGSTTRPITVLFPLTKGTPSNFATGLTKKLDGVPCFLSGKGIPATRPEKPRPCF
jgi:hypothetical protein